MTGRRRRVAEREVGARRVTEKEIEKKRANYSILPSWSKLYKVLSPRVSVQKSARLSTVHNALDVHRTLGPA